MTSKRHSKLDAYGYLRSLTLLRDRVPNFDQFPFAIPAVGKLRTLQLDPKVTFFVGENGSGKSTLIEAIATLAGFNAEGGSKNFNFSERRSESDLHQFLRLARGIRRERDGFFLRAETFFNAATYIERTDPGLLAAYGGKSLHAQSHGESFIALALNRFRGEGLYILDEPEAALSPARQLTFLKIIDVLVRQQSSQFLIATHSPILMAYPNATIYSFTSSGIQRIEYEDTEHFQITRDFILGRDRFFQHLFTDEKENEDG